MSFVMAGASPGWWTANRDLVILNAVLATATLVVACVGVATIRSSNRMAGSSNRMAKAAEEQAAASLALATSAEAQAKATNESVEAALDQVALSQATLEHERETLRASIRPVVVDVPLGLEYGLDDNGDRGLDKGLVLWTDAERTNELTLKVPFRNIGLGPAFVYQALLTTGPGSVFEAASNYRVIPTGEVVQIDLTMSSTDIGFGVVLAAFKSGSFAAGLKYSDLGDSQRTQSVISMEREESGRFTVTRTELYHCDENWIRETDPFVSGGPS